MLSVAAALASKAAANVFIVSAKRTPIGSFGGKLKGISATELGVVAGSAAIKAANIDPKLVDHVVFGNVRGVKWGGVDQKEKKKFLLGR